ncbi:MAG: transposase [Deltaproteobacteria bacterium]|nr:transposase [Deltaproteobacteria bacterium]
MCRAKYRPVVFSDTVDAGLTEICQEREDRYEMMFLEIGTDREQQHFLVQRIPTLSRSLIR